MPPPKTYRYTSSAPVASFSVAVVLASTAPRLAASGPSRSVTYWIWRSGSR